MEQNLALRVVKQASGGAGGVGLFAVIRNEDYFLPFFFDHYRSLGVGTFLIYDDRSDDETLAFLHAQADCTIVASDRAYGDSFGLDANGAPRKLIGVLKESLPATAFPDRWALTVDADEFLILPSGFGDLPALTAHLDRIGQPYATAPMVDFYGETLDRRNYSRAISPFQGNPYFDAGPYYRWKRKLTPKQLGAGFRHRLLEMLRLRRPDQVERIYGQKAQPPKAWKTPLLKNGAGIARIADHEISVTPSVKVAAALAHFKFYPGLDAKIDLALAEQQYFNRSVEYAFLEAVTRLLGHEPLIARETRTFTGPRSLEQAGLLRS